MRACARESLAHLEHQRVQRHVVDLGDGVRGEGVVVGLCVEAVADPGARAPGAPLLGAGPADPELLQTLHLGFGVEAHLLHLA